MRILFTGLLAFGIVVIFSCDQEDINDTCADPIGTDTKTLQSYSLTCFGESFVGCLRFQFDSDPPVIQSVYINDVSDAPQIFDVGEISCLSKVTDRPDTGWSYALYAYLHHGYVVKMKDGTLGRFYIDSFESTSGQITDVNITRQYSY